MSLTVLLFTSNVIILGLYLFNRWQLRSSDPFSGGNGKKLQKLDRELRKSISEQDKLKRIARDKDAKYLALFEGASDGVLLVSLESGQIVDCNNSICDSLGYSRDEFLALKLSDLEQNASSKFSQRFARIRATGHEKIKSSLRNRKGEFEQLNITGNAIQFGSQILAQYIVHLNKKSNVLTIDSVTEELWSKTSDAFFSAFAQHLFVSYHAEFILVGAMENSDQVKGIYAFYNGLQIDNIDYELNNSPCKYAVKNGLYSSPTATREKFPSFPLLDKFQIESYVGIALNQPSDSVSGIFCILSTRKQENPGQIVTILRIFSAKACAELERRHAEQKYRLYQQILDNSSDLLSFVGPDYRYRVVNRYYQEIFGKDPNELIGQSPEIIFGSDHYGSVIKKNLDRCFVGEKFVTRIEKNHPETGMRQLECKLNPVKDSNGAVSGVTINARDITDLLKAEQEQKFRVNLLESLTRKGVISEILKQIIRWVESDDPACLCSIMLLDRDRKKLLRGAAPSLPEFYIEAFNELEIGNGVGCCGTAAATGERVIVEDIHSHPFWQKYKALTKKVRLKSCWSQPIKSSTGSILGTFAIYYLETKKPTPRDLKRIESVASIASIAIERHAAEIERQRLELQLRQAQKMEAIGQLTGGIAHDFNNILGSILGFTGLALNRCIDGNPEKLESYLTEIKNAGERARDLIQQMLAFSRTGLKKPERLKINGEIEKSFALLRPLIPTSIALESTLSRNDLWVLAAPNQLEQIILNLCINAKDAIDGQGEIAFFTGEYSARHSLCTSCCASFSGIYAELAITDSGSGIAKNILEHVFEPFFSTKEVGQGSGMGLPMVHGIVHEYDGHVCIESDPGNGTTVRIFFPILEEEPPLTTRSFSNHRAVTSLIQKHFEEN